VIRAAHMSHGRGGGYEIVCQSDNLPHFEDMLHDHDVCFLNKV